MNFCRKDLVFKLVQEKLSISIENIEEMEEKQCSVVSEAMGESGALLRQPGRLWHHRHDLI